MSSNEEHQAAEPPVTKSTTLTDATVILDGCQPMWSKKDLLNQCVKVMFITGGTLTSRSLNICHQFNLSGSSDMNSVLQWSGNSQPRLAGCI